MLIHYFLVGLGALSLEEKPEISSQKFLSKARSCLNSKTVEDLEKLELLSSLDLAIREKICAENLGNDFDISSCDAYKVLNIYYEKVNQKRLSTKAPEDLRRLFWQMIIEDCQSRFLQNFAEQAVKLYEAVALCLSKNSGLSLDSRYKLKVLLNNGLKSADPMDLEKAMATYLFSIADEYAKPGMFDVDAVFVYFIKLLICERFSTFNEKSGQQILAAMVENVRQGALNERA